MIGLGPVRGVHSLRGTFGQVLPGVADGLHVHGGLLRIRRAYRIDHLKRPGILRLSGRENRDIIRGGEMRRVEAMHQFAVVVFEPA